MDLSRELFPEKMTDSCCFVGWPSIRAQRLTVVVIKNVVFALEKSDWPTYAQYSDLKVVENTSFSMNNENFPGEPER